MIKNQKAIVECVSLMEQLPVVAECTSEELLELAFLFRSVAYKERDAIVRQDENFEALFLIASGLVEVSKQERVGKEIQTKVVATLWLCSESPGNKLVLARTYCFYGYFGNVVGHKKTTPGC